MQYTTQHQLEIPDAQLNAQQSQYLARNATDHASMQSQYLVRIVGSLVPNVRYYMLGTVTTVTIVQ